MSCPPLILLVHRVPYPPNKGDKIRSYHLLRYLATRYEVFLGAFADDPADLEYADTLRQWCADVFLETLGPVRSRMRMLPALLTKEPLSVAAYRSAAMRRWVSDTVKATGASRFLAFSTAMAQYADVMPAGARRVLDMVDVDSDKWRQYGERHRGPIGYLYRREARCLLARERAAAEAHDAITLVSQAECDLFRRRAPAAAERVEVLANGVDCDYFRPSHEFADPFAAGIRPIVFTGAMDYWPNIDAVTWFADEVLPRVRARHAGAVFHVVGSRPARAVRALSSRPGIEVVGAVPDVRPWLAHARLVVAPLRVARGIQNKVLEGFAMARPVLATSMALEGLELADDYPLRADRAERFARLATEVLDEGDGHGLGARMRARVSARYDWTQRLDPFARLLEEPPPAVRSEVDRRAAG